MGAQTEPSTEGRVPLSRDRVLRAAVELADREGIAALTMRSLARALGVEAMSLYYHVANKEALLDGMVEAVVTEVNEAAAALESPSPASDWRGALRARVLEARRVMLRHRWAPAVIESRTAMTPAVVLYFEGVLGIMRAGGLSYDLGHQGLHALGSRALGFAQELFQPSEGEADTSDELMAEMVDRLPHLLGMLAAISHDTPDTTLGWCDDQREFEFGLDLLLDGLERLRTA